MLLIHGNRQPGPDGGSSPQLNARVLRAIQRYYDDKQDQVDLICYFAADRNPDGTWGRDVVERMLAQTSIDSRKIVLKSTARNTREEVDAFLTHGREIKYFGPLEAVTSDYHGPRSNLCFWRRGQRVTLHTTPESGRKDRILEPVKLAWYSVSMPFA